MVPLQPRGGGGAAVEIRGLRVCYGPLVAVDGLDLDVRPGEILGLLGRNGAGKTTTIETMVGLQRGCEGSVRVLGMDPWRDALLLRQRIGVQLQEPVFHPYLGLLEALELLGSFYQRRPDPLRLLEGVGLASQARARFGQLSGGSRRRFLLALAMVGDPDLIVLDEPTAGLDPHARQGLLALVRESRAQGRTVMLATHHLEEARLLCDRVAVLHKGRLRALGAPVEFCRRTGGDFESAFLALTGEAEAGGDPW